MFGHFGLKIRDTQNQGESPLNEEPDKDLSIEERVSNYLDTQGCVLWGQFFDIQSKEGRKQASEFILDILIDLGITREMVE